MTARRGSRIEGGLRSVATTQPVETVRYVAGARGLDVGYFHLTENVEVPGAAGWLRREAWESARRLKAIGPDEVYIDYDSFIETEVARLGLGPSLKPVVEDEAV